MFCFNDLEKSSYIAIQFLNIAPQFWMNEFVPLISGKYLV